jgi:anti-sigma factor RsiW
MTMSFTTDDYDVLRRYLLGRLVPESEEAVEARLFSDDRVFWERLSLVEEELISDYARGALDHDEREDFEQRFLCTDERRGKVEFARALQNYAERQHIHRETRWRWLRSPVVVPAWTAAAAVILLLVVPGAVWQLALRGRGQDSGPADAGSVVTVSLSSGLTRAVGVELARVRITPASQLVRLQLDPGSEEYAAYRATLHEVSGDEIWSQARLMPSPGAGGRVILALPSALLAEGDYFVRLSGVSPGIDPVSLHRYDFRVLRE